MSPLVFRRQLAVEWGQCDPAGILFSRRFFEIFDTNTWFLFEVALGVMPQDIAAHFGIIGVPLVDARATFHKPVKFGDKIEVVSHISSFRRSSFDVEHRVLLEGEVASEGVETRVWATRSEVNPERISAAPVPESVITKFGHNPTS